MRPKRRCLQSTKTQQTTTQQKPNQNNTKRHPGNYVKHYAFRKSPSHSVLLRDDIGNPTHRCPMNPSLEVHVGGGPVSSQSRTRVKGWFTHVHVDETAQGRSTIFYINSRNTCQKPKEGLYPCFRSLKGDHRGPSIPLW